MQKEKQRLFTCLSPACTVMLPWVRAYVGCHISDKVLAGAKLAHCTATWQLAEQSLLHALQVLWSLVKHNLFLALPFSPQSVFLINCHF